MALYPSTTLYPSATLFPEDPPREALAIVFADDDAADTAGTAAYVDGNTFVNNGRRAVLLRNASGSPVTVRFELPVEIDGVPVSDRTVVVPGESEVMTGMWPPKIYNRPDGTVAIDYTSVTGLSVTVIEPRA